MPVVTIPVLKGYFANGKVLSYPHYEDLIDTLLASGGDMQTSVYDTNSNGIVDNAEALGGVAAFSYLQRTSVNRPGVTKLYRYDSDTGYYLRHNWTGIYWRLRGYDASDAFHAETQVGFADAAPWTGITGKPTVFPPSSHTHLGSEITTTVATATNADTVDGLHASSFHREDQNLIASGYDIRTNQGVYIGAIGTDPTNGHLHATSHGHFGGGVYVGSASVNPSYNGLVEATSNIITNNQFFGRGQDHYFRTTLNIGNATDVDVNRLTLARDLTHGHIYVNTNGSYGSSLYLNWYGQTTYFTRVRIGNGQSAYGIIHADEFVNESTRASKRNIRKLEYHCNPLVTIESLEPVVYKKSNPKSENYDNDRFGLIADDLVHILPEVVSFDEDGIPEGIDYGQIVPLLIAAVKDLNEQVKELSNGRNNS